MVHAFLRNLALFALNCTLTLFQGVPTVPLNIQVKILHQEDFDAHLVTDPDSGGGKVTLLELTVRRANQ